MSIATVCASVIVLVILVAVLWHRRAAKSGFMPGDPASPQVREAVAMVHVALRTIISSSDGLGEVPQGVRLTVQAICEGVRPLANTVQVMTPTYGNALGLYRGISACSMSFSDAAVRLYDASAALDPHAKKNLQQVSGSIMYLGRASNYLGAALGLE